MIATKLLFNQRHGLDSEMCTFSQSSAVGLNMSYATYLHTADLSGIHVHTMTQDSDVSSRVQDSLSTE